MMPDQMGGFGGGMGQQGNNMMGGQGGMQQNSMGGRMNGMQQQQPNQMRQSNPNDQQLMMMGGNRQSQGYGQGMDVGGYPNYNYDPFGQPLFGQQYYQRSGNSEDFRQASRYTTPRGRQGVVGNYDSSYVGASLLDDTRDREQRLRSYRMNDQPNDFGWLGSRNPYGSSDFNYRSDGRRSTNFRNMTPREREMNQRRIDGNNNDRDRERRYYDEMMYRDNIERNMEREIRNQSRKRNNNPINNFQKDLLRQGSPTRGIADSYDSYRGGDRYQDRGGFRGDNRDDYNSPNPNGRYSNIDDFRQRGSSDRRNLGTPREREMRQIEDNRALGRGLSDRNDQYNGDSRYNNRGSGTREIRSDDYGRGRPMNNNIYEDGRDREKYYDIGGVRRDSSKYYDDGRSFGRKKTSVWENLRDAFKL